MSTKCVIYTLFFSLRCTNTGAKDYCPEGYNSTFRYLLYHFPGTKASCTGSICTFRAFLRPFLRKEMPPCLYRVQNVNIMYLIKPYHVPCAVVLSMQLLHVLSPLTRPRNAGESVNGCHGQLIALQRRTDKCFRLRIYQPSFVV